MGASRASKIRQLSESMEREYIRARDEGVRERMMVRDAVEGWADWWAEFSREWSILKIDLSLKQTRSSDLQTRRPLQLAKPKYERVPVETVIPIPADVAITIPRRSGKVIARDAETVTLLVNRTCVVDLDYDGDDVPLPAAAGAASPRLVKDGRAISPTLSSLPSGVSQPTRRRQAGVVNVRLKSKPVSRERARLTAPESHVSETVVEQIATRIGNGLNRQLLGNASRASRRKRPERMPILIAQHDNRTRRHLHILIAVPPHVTPDDVHLAMKKILKNERFSYPNGVEDPRCCVIEQVRNLRASVFYNVNHAKSLSHFPIAYFSMPNRPKENNSNESSRPERSAPFPHPVGSSAARRLRAA